jgi:predicted ATPase
VQTLAWNRCVRGWARAHTGEIDAGIAELSSAIEASKRIMGYIAWPQLNAMIAEALLLRDDVAAAEGWLQRAIAFADSHHDRYFSAELYRLSAQCAIRRGQDTAALDHLRQAIEVARSQGADTFALRAAIMLAHLQPERGRSALEAVLTGFPEPEPWPDIEEARRAVS